MSLNIRNLAARLFQRFTKPSTLKALPNRARLSVTALEDRVVPTAGSVVSIEVTHATEGGAAVVQLTRTDTTDSATGTFTLTGTATPGVDYSEFGNFAFAPEQATFVRSFTALPDALVEETETVYIALTAVTGCTIGGLGYDVVNITDTTPVITVAKLSDAVENVSDGAFRFTRTGDLTASLTAKYTAGGTAGAGIDYTALYTASYGTVTFAASSSTADVTVAVLDDSTTEYDEAIVATLESDTGYAIGEASQATVVIGDDETPLVRLQTDANALEGVSDGRIWFTRLGDLRAELPVTIEVSGTAAEGTDFTALGTTVTFAAGNAYAVLDVEALTDSAYDPDETVVVTIQAGTGYQYDIVYATTLTIEDAIPLVTVEKITDAWEDGREGAFLFRRTGDLTASLTVDYTISGDATEEDDYEELAGSIEFAAGASEAEVVITPVNDSNDDPGEVVTLTIDDTSSEYEVDTLHAASLMVVDDETQLVTVAKISDGFEGGTGGMFRFTRTGDISASLTVSYTATGTATSGTDYTALSGSVMFAATEATVDVLVTLGSDTSAEDTETIIVQVTSGTLYGADPNAIDVSYLVDDDTNTGRIGGVVWTDEDGNGIRETGEDLAVGFSVTLRDERGNRVFETVTDSSGAYEFRGLAEGTYFVRFYSPLLYWFAPANEGSDESTDSDVDTDSGYSEAISLITSAMTKTNVGAGFVLTAAPAPNGPTIKFTYDDGTDYKEGPAQDIGKSRNFLKVAKWSDAFKHDTTGINSKTVLLAPNAKGLDFIDRDPDRFNVRVYDSVKWGEKNPDNSWKNLTLTATISTSNETAFAAYNDTETKISLVRIPDQTGWYWSDSQILVSSEVDDKYDDPMTYFGKDDVNFDVTKTYKKGDWTIPISDRTHRIALGGTVTIKYDTGNVNVGTNGIIEATGKVKVVKQVTVSPHFLTAGPNAPRTGEPYEDTNDNGIHDAKETYWDVNGDRKYTEQLDATNMMKRFDRDLSVANEVYAQVGLRFVKGTGEKTGVFEAPIAIGDGAIVLSNPGPIVGDQKLTPSEKAILVGGNIPAVANNNPIAGAFNTLSTKDVEVYYVRSAPPDDWMQNTPSNPHRRGHSFSSNFYKQMKTVDLNDSLILSEMADYYVLAHELYHVLAQEGHSDKTFHWNVFRASPTQISVTTETKITDSRRLTQAQQLIVTDTSNKYAENPS